ncbi:uncharacterized protein LOC118755311 [Rhagoletis pomonella]|uniref:uncharacterized protein LOC118755311 n=1 Tax=Rhagoletis pomonella TaxID=28610 RepID=UPI00177C8FDB|nr:uncharacterized protein LOC118755311 [Rhagoletis pomonella]
MIRTRKRRRSAEPGQQAEANEVAIVQPSIAANFAAAVPTAAPAETEFPHWLNEIKVEASDSEAEFVKEDESTLADIKPDIHEIQKQCIRSQQSPHAERMSTPTSLLATSTQSAAVAATAGQVNLSGDYVLDIDKLVEDVSAQSLREDFQIKVKDEIIDEEKRESSDKLKPLTLNRSDFNFVADEIDMQETDSDEDGYSDVDLDDDYEPLESDEIEDLYDPEWFNRLTMPRRLFPDQNYQGILKGGTSRNLHTFYFYHILEGQNFFERVAECCNKRAEKIKKGSQRWSNTCTEAFTWQEISIFIGISLQMGSMQLPTLSEYWECQSHHGFNGFSTKMTLNRFKFLLEALNFECFQTENCTFNTEDMGNRFDDLKPLLNFFNNRMESIYSCGQTIVLNEPLIYWKGKLNQANEMSKKFRRNAVMLHLLTKQSGMVLKILADMEGSEQKQISRNPKAQVVQRLSKAIELLKEKFGRGHVVFTCKYYGSYALCLELAKLGTYCSGFLDKNCFGNSKELVLQNLGQYQFETRYAGYVMMGKSRRLRKNVYFYSSDCLAIYRNEMILSHQLKLVKEISWQLGIPVEMRAAMLDYQLPLERTEIKWDRRLMIYVIHLVLLNAYLLYQSHNQNLRSTNKLPMFFKQFRQGIIASLVHPDESGNIDKKSPANENLIDTATTINNSERDPNLHIPSQLDLKKATHRPMEIPCSKGKLVKKRCRICFKTGLLIFSQFCCAECPGMPGLCENPCFKLWHEYIE